MKLHMTVRRIHVYLGLFLLVFFLKYGVSAIPFAHGPWFNKFYKDVPLWTLRYEKPCTIPVPTDAGPEELREIGAEIMKDNNITGSFGAWRNNPKVLAVHHNSFSETVRIMYFIDRGVVVVEDKTFRWDDFLRTFHWLGGYQQNRFISDLWAFFIDMVCIGLIVWGFSGIVIWWRTPKNRLAGSIALAAGFLTFAAFIMFL